MHALVPSDALVAVGLQLEQLPGEAVSPLDGRGERLWRVAPALHDSIVAAVRRFTDT